MNEGRDTRVLTDEDLEDATEDQLSVHYKLLAERFGTLRPEQAPHNVNDLIQALARTVGCRPTQITYVAAVETPSHPLTDEEWAATKLPEDQWQDFLNEA